MVHSNIFICHHGTVCKHSPTQLVFQYSKSLKVMAILYHPLITVLSDAPQAVQHVAMAMNSSCA